MRIVSKLNTIYSHLQHRGFFMFKCTIRATVAEIRLGDLNKSRARFMDAIAAICRPTIARIFSHSCKSRRTHGNRWRRSVMAGHGRGASHYVRFFDLCASIIRVSINHRGRYVEDGAFVCCIVLCGCSVSFGR